MIPRSYHKFVDIPHISGNKTSLELSTKLPKIQDMKPGHGVGDYFDKIAKRNKSLTDWKDDDNNLIGKFIKENERMEQKLKKEEDDLWKYKHSKHNIQWNGWKPANHIIEDFGIHYNAIGKPIGERESIYFTGKQTIEKGDHDYIPPDTKKCFCNEDPFWNSHKDGGYFFDRKGVNIHKY